MKKSKAQIEKEAVIIADELEQLTWDQLSQVTMNHHDEWGFPLPDFSPDFMEVARVMAETYWDKAASEKEIRESFATYPYDDDEEDYEDDEEDSE